MLLTKCAKLLTFYVMINTSLVENAINFEL